MELYFGGVLLGGDIVIWIISIGKLDIERFFKLCEKFDKVCEIWMVGSSGLKM